MRVITGTPTPPCSTRLRGFLKAKYEGFWSKKFRRRHASQESSGPRHQMSVRLREQVLLRSLRN
jgi:hypothetical protein